MGHHTDRLAQELRALHEAAQRPTLQQLADAGARQQPPLAGVSVATVSNWLNGDTVPGRSQSRYFLALVRFLQSRTDGRTPPRSEGAWQQMLKKAREERDRNRGGRPSAGRPEPAPCPVTLPPEPPGFTGRAGKLAELLAWLDPDSEDSQATVVVSAVAGMGGVGKTALAVHAAHQARSRGWFPGGILFADLRGCSSGSPVETGAVVDQFLHALGVKAKDLPASSDGKLDAWRVFVRGLAARGKPLLAVLDNAHSAGQIRALLPDPPHRVLVTSRQNLSALAAHQLELDSLDPDEATALLDAALRAGDTGDDRATAQASDARRLAELCGGLPLALQITAALLRDDPLRPLADQVSELADARARLDLLAYDDVDDQGRPLAVRAAFDLSYERLTDAQRRAFRLLSACDQATGVSTECAAALFDEHPAAARRRLTELARAHLLDQPVPERWSQHDLLSLYADEQGLAHADADHRSAARNRLVDHYQRHVGAASTWLRLTPAKGARTAQAEVFDSRAKALTWLDAEHRNVSAAVATAQRFEEWDRAYSLALAICPYLEFRQHTEDWLTTAGLAVDAARELGDAQRTWAHSCLGTANRVAGRYDVSLHHLRQARTYAPDRSAKGAVHHNLGLTFFRRTSTPRPKRPTASICGSAGRRRMRPERRWR